MFMNDTYYTIKEFAALVKVHPNTIRRAIKFENIMVIKLNKKKKCSYRIPATELDRIVAFQREEI